MLTFSSPQFCLLSGVLVGKDFVFFKDLTSVSLTMLHCVLPIFSSFAGRGGGAWGGHGGGFCGVVD